MLLNEILKRALERYPERIALSCGDHEFSYAELADRVARFAQALRDFGIQTGDRIAILHRNCHRMLEAYFAAVHVGAVLVPLNYRLTASDLARIVDDTESSLLIADDGWTELARELTSSTRIPVTVVWSHIDGHVDDREYDYEEWITKAEPTSNYRPLLREHDAANIYYTSGTTGHQKGVVLTHRNISSHALATVEELELCGEDAWAHVAPMFHLADAWATWAITQVGGRHVMVGRFEPEAALSTMAETGVTLTNLIPTMLNDLVNAPNVLDFDLSSLRLIMSGGAPIAPELVCRIVATFGCEYVQTYGLTETSPYLTFSLLKPHLRQLPEDEQMRYRSMTGRPVQGVELRVVDGNGDDVPADGRAVGEILAKGDRITPGYWRLPGATAEAFSDGWFKTGDLATIESEGYLNIVDRKKDVILTGGEQVYSTEVENALYEHPAVLEAAVVGAPDERLGELVTAVIVVRDGCAASEEELVAHCRGRLAGFKCPRVVRFVERLPRTGSGKIAKLQIRKMFSE
ncbi:MAG: long-chain-fatty-acid--CoA ligase [bacterium]|nr:long-chain-fatty-acid--CoA ligase [bacterium]